MKKFSLIAITLTLFLVFTAFTSKINKSRMPDNEYTEFTTPEHTEFTVKDYYFKQCTFCHSPSERLAPYMPKIKNVYIKKYPDEYDFIQKIADFVLEPKEEKRLYKTADFETMPPEMFHDPDKIKAVARYIYRENNL